MTKSNLVQLARPSPESHGSHDKGEQDKKASKRMTVQFSEAQTQHLDWLAETQQISQAEALRKALATESYLRQAIMDGSKILIKDEDGLRELVLR